MTDPDPDFTHVRRMRADDFASASLGIDAPVSYTHLDVYKRQSQRQKDGPPG